MSYLFCRFRACGGPGTRRTDSLMRCSASISGVVKVTGSFPQNRGTLSTSAAEAIPISASRGGRDSLELRSSFQLSRTILNQSSSFPRISSRASSSKSYKIRTPSSSSSSSLSEPCIQVSTTTLPVPHSHLVLGHVTIHNALKLNTLTPTLLSQLHTAFTTTLTLESHPKLTAIILTGASPPPSSTTTYSFSAGASLPILSSLGSPSAARKFITLIHEVCHSVRTHAVPVIARIHGPCLGAGLELAASCDLRVATSTSTFAMPEVKVGVPSVVEARLLPQLVGWARARRMMLLGETVTAAQAESWGLVDEIVSIIPPSPLAGTETTSTKQPLNSNNQNSSSSSSSVLTQLTTILDAKTQQLVSILASSAPHAVRAQKRLMRAWEDADDVVPQGIALGVDAFVATWEDPRARDELVEFTAKAMMALGRKRERKEKG